MGAWIETMLNVSAFARYLVAPYVGAWIETIYNKLLKDYRESHPMWVRGLKLNLSINKLILRSHPMWVRGLKQPLGGDVDGGYMSHPMWVRGLKRVLLLVTNLIVCRTLCGCVD